MKTRLCSSSFKIVQVILSNMRKSVSSEYPNTEKWVEKTRRSVSIPDEIQTTVTGHLSFYAHFKMADI